jgi:hypothetical protein
LAFGYEGIAGYEDIASRKWLTLAARRQQSRSSSYDERFEAIERCRAAKLNNKCARQPFDTLYFNIYNELRQAVFVRPIHGVTEL